MNTDLQMIPQRLHRHIKHRPNVGDHACVGDYYIQSTDFGLDARDGSFVGRLVPGL